MTTAREAAELGDLLWEEDRMRPDDKRQTCHCGHRYRDHGPAHGTGEYGGKCLAFVDDPDRSSLYMCSCEEWRP